MSQKQDKSDARPISSLMKQLIDERERAGLTQRDVGELLTPEDWRNGQSYLARWESGKVKPSAEVLERLADIYNLKWVLTAK